LLRSPAYKARIKAVSTGVVESRLRLYTDDLYRLEALLPSLPEQAVIVRFLDHVDRRIRRYIRAKQKLIKLLEEQKQAIIHRAVTRGLDPNVRLKSSGVEWLGEMPEHWKQRRLKLVVRNINEQTELKLPDEIYVALEQVESWTGRITLTDGDVAFDSQVKRFQPNDVLFGKLRPYLAKVARPLVLGVCVGEFLVLRVTDSSILPEFLERKLRSKQLIDLINSSTFGAKMPRADWGFIGNVTIVYPPSHKEQRAVLNYIIEHTVTLQTAIEHAQREISLLREYRTRLIADVVTGKLDVREAAANLPDETDELETLEDDETLADENVVAHDGSDAVSEETMD